MTDLRKEVEDDRGLLKKIQLFIPGFRGYRQREDIRIADSMLRTQVADSVKIKLLKPLESSREEAANALELDFMNDIAGVISKAKMIEAKIRHAQQGYSGISAGTRIEQDELNRLYELDLSLLEDIKYLGENAEKVYQKVSGGNYPEAVSDVKNMKAEMQKFAEHIDQRIILASGIVVE